MILNSRLSNNFGFTTKELIMVIAVIALLCFAAIPQFFAMQSARHQTEMEKVVAVVQAGILREQAKNIALNNNHTFMPALDDQPSGQICQSCFNKILARPVNINTWYKVSDHEYLFSRNDDSGDLNAYQQNGDFRIIYDSDKGTLTAQQIIK